MAEGKRKRAYEPGKVLLTILGSPEKVALLIATKPTEEGGWEATLIAEGKATPLRAK